MKQMIGLLFVLAFTACLLAACGGQNTQPAKERESAAAETAPEESGGMEENAGGNGTPEAAGADRTMLEAEGLERLTEQVELPEDPQTEYEVTDIQTYEEETVWRYAQTYGGVEVYGSSVLVASGAEDYVAGICYDLTEAFEENFDAQVAEAETVPSWMTAEEGEGASLTYDTGTLRAVIYVTGEEAVVARCVEVRLETEEESCVFELVFSLDGSILYDYSELNQTMEFSDAEITGAYSLTLSVEDNTYYAYNQEYNFFVTDQRTRKKASAWAEAHSAWDEALGHRTVELDKSVIYSTGTSRWTKGAASTVLESAAVFYDVARWYDEHFGWVGLNNDGSACMIQLTDESGSPAANYSSAVILMNSEVVQAPEVLAHEFGHSVFSGLTGSSKTENESGALNEAVSDVFAVLYLGDGSWRIGANIGNCKDLISAQKIVDGEVTQWPIAMKDYAMDSVWFSEEMDWKTTVKKVLDFLPGVDIRCETSNQHTHGNSAIVSHTLYRIWDEVLDRDDEVLGNLLFQCLRYVPVGGGFSQFRDAFLYAMRQHCDIDTVMYASTFFDMAGIWSAGSDNLARIRRQVLASTNQCIFDVASMTYGELCALGLDMEIFEDQDGWICDVRWNDAVVAYISYASGDIPKEETYPYWVNVQDFQGGAAYAPVMEGITTGMTYYEFIAGNDDPPELYSSEFFGVMCADFETEDGALVTLYFEDPEESGILTMAEIIYPDRKGN